MLERIGIYGGSFDPIHFGHLILAREAKEQLGLSRVLFVPAVVSPHKLDRPPSSPGLRCRVLQAAIEEEPGFEMDDSEIRRQAVPSYTIDTVRLLRERHPGVEMDYFIGDDNLSELHTWKEIDLLRELVRFVVLSRGGHPVPEGMPVVRRRIDISSTDIRNRIASGQSVRYLLPEKAWHILINQSSA